jgi:hypothetical protein
MSPQFALFVGDMGSTEVKVEAADIGQAIRQVEAQTGQFVICGSRVS